MVVVCSTHFDCRFKIDEDINAIIQKGEERTAELNSKYEGLNFDDLNNFKSDPMLQWEGEDFKNGVSFVVDSFVFRRA